GTSSPSATLDVGGSFTNGKSLFLRSGEGPTETDSAQILFGYNNTNSYTHSIRTRHNSSSGYNNAIEFWLWTPSDTTTAIGSTRVMSLAGTGNVSIGTTSQYAKLNVIGDIYVDQDDNNNGGYITEASLGGIGLVGNGARLPDLYVTDSGRVGIGIVTPSVALDVIGDARINSTGTALLTIRGDSNNSTPDTGEVTGVLSFATDGATAAGATPTNGITIEHENGNGTNALSIKDYLTGTATERFRIHSNGNVGIGTATPTSKFTVEGAGVVANIGGNSGGILQVRQINGKSAASAANDVLFLNYGTGFNVNVGGGPGTSLLTVFGPGSTCTLGNGTGATNCTSDARLKKDIQPISGALEKLALIKGVTFHWKDPKKAEPEHLGVIAQDVEKVFPQAVTTISDTTLPGGTAKAVDYAVLVAPLIEAVKELKARNEALQTAVEAIQVDFAAYKAAHP
ncbi:MAG: tail fiber domain-containing protein, partial [Methylococcales bacterium]|nr:tail fiber domain-containing protein [Methylococcales bacterium]